MSREKIIEILNHSSSYLSYRKKIKEEFPELDSTLASGRYSYAEELYLYIHDLQNRPTCKFCSKELKYIDRKIGYNTYCSHRCYVNDGCGKESREITNLQKYGTTNPLGNDAIKGLRKQTMIKKYGSEFPLQNEQLRLKAQSSYALRDQNEINKKRKETLKERYDVDNLWNIPEYRTKIETTNMEKYGQKYSLANKDIKESISHTRLTEFYQVLKNRFDDIELISGSDEYIGINKFNGGTSYLWKCKQCNNIFEDYVRYGYNIICCICHPGHLTRGEYEIKQFLDNHKIQYILKDRSILKPKELDFYLPEFNLAIEYCGLYWHSELKVEKNYHKEKYTRCNEKGIRLITIFEDEWFSNKEICENRLLSLLHLLPVTCGARQGVIEDISTTETKDFLNKTHIQGYVVSTVNIGLKFRNQLVAIMTFGPLRKLLNGKKEEGTVELLRFSTVGHIPGAASKLFAYFIKYYHPKRIISYCDLRWGSGNVYDKLGMTLIKETEPGYWYSKDGIKRYHRSSFTKKSLIDKGYFGDTEVSIMRDLGYYRIWDCGNKKFELITHPSMTNVPDINS